MKKHQNSTNNNSSETALQLLLHNPKTNSECYSPFINSTDVKIHSAAFSVLGNIAITWQKSDHFYVTMYELNNVKKNNELDLSINAIPLTDLSDQLLATDKNSLISAKVSMFLLDGSQLGIKITYKTSPPIVSSTFTKFIPIHQAPLTPAEKVKRLGIPTKDALQLVRKDKKEKYSKSMQ